MKSGFFALLLVIISVRANLKAQDTFSILGIDSLTGEIGAAGGSCVDLFVYYTSDPVSFIAEVVPNVGAIATQAAYDPTNQQNAKTRMMAGDSPAQIINWLAANDVSNYPHNRQYGVVKFVEGSPKSAAYTGSNCFPYKNHISGPNYSIQGNILSGQAILDSMEARFLNEPGDLACKLMAALQGAKKVGADTRCAPNNSSTLFAFIKVAKPLDTEENPSLYLALKTHSLAMIEPIDSLQKMFNEVRTCTVNTTGIDDLRRAAMIRIFPNPAANELFVTVSGPGIADCKVAGILGQELLGIQFEKTGRIDLSRLPAGVYAVEVLHRGSKVTRKLIIE